MRRYDEGLKGRRYLVMVRLTTSEPSTIYPELPRIFHYIQEMTPSFLSEWAIITPIRKTVPVIPMSEKKK